MHALLRRILTLTAPIVSALLLLTACGSSSINTGTAVTPTPTTQQVVQPTDIPTPVPHFKVGQTVQVGNIWQITIKSVKLTNGGQYDSAPAAGNTYLVISVSAKNISATEQQFFGSAGFTLRDPSGQEITTTYISVAKPEPSGKVESGAPIAGDLAYDVPTSVKTFTLSYEENMYMPGQTLWDITV